MKKLFRNLALSGVLAAGAAGLVSMAPETALGQNPKAPQPPAKGTTPGTVPVKPTAPAEVKGKVVIKKDKSGKFRFQIHDEADKTLAMSTVGYDTIEEATKMIETVKVLLNTQKPVEEK